MKTSNPEMHPLHDVPPVDAIGMLIADHKRVANLFADFKRATDESRDDDKGAIVEKICRELTIHTQIEEDLFYPAVRKLIDDDDQMDEAVVEHAGAKQLIRQLQRADPADELYDAKVTVLGEQIDHHVDEEEGSMFPKVRYAGVDTLTLGAAMQARKSELQAVRPGSGAAAAKAAETDADDEQDDEPALTKRVPARKRSAKSKSPAKAAKKRR